MTPEKIRKLDLSSLKQNEIPLVLLNREDIFIVEHGKFEGLEFIYTSRNGSLAKILDTEEVILAKLERRKVNYTYMPVSSIVVSDVAQERKESFQQELEEFNLTKKEIDPILTEQVENQEDLFAMFEKIHKVKMADVILTGLDTEDAAINYPYRGIRSGNERKVGLLNWTLDKEFSSLVKNIAIKYIKDLRGDEKDIFMTQTVLNTILCRITYVPNKILSFRFYNDE